MPKRLRLDLINPGAWLFPLALRAAIFSALLFFADFGNWAVFLFFVSSFYFYFRPSLNNSRFFYSFFVLIACSLVILNGIHAFGYRFWTSLFFGALFFILLGIKNLAFINRQILYYVINGFLLLSVFVSFFSANKSEWFVFKYFAAGLGIFFILREFLAFFLKENKANSIYDPKKFISLSALALSFLAMEIMWAVALLPIGFLNSSALLLVFTLILEDFLLNYSMGKLNPPLIMRNITIFAILVLAIFGASSWNI